MAKVLIMQVISYTLGLTMRRFHSFWLNYLPFTFSLILLFCCPTDFIAQTLNRPTHQPKPTIRVLTLGHENHGKSTLTAAITKVLYKTGRAKFVPYDDIENPPEIEVQGIKVAAAQVEYETDKARYVHIDCRNHSDYIKLLTSGGGGARRGYISCVCARRADAADSRAYSSG